MSYPYRKYHCGYKTILQPSYLHNGGFYTGKIVILNQVLAAQRGQCQQPWHELFHPWYPDFGTTTVKVSSIYYSIGENVLVSYEDRATGIGLTRDNYKLFAIEYLVRHLTVQKNYRKLSNIRRTKSQNLNVSHFGLQLSLRNVLKPSVGWRMKM